MPWISASGVQGLSAMRVWLKPVSPYMLKTGIPIIEAGDDAEEGADGETNTTSSDLEMVMDASKQIVGLRYDKINLAPSSEIRSAYIQFTSHAANGEETELEIRAEMVGSALPFQQTEKNISSRVTTSQSVIWKPAAWKKADERAELQRTPNLAALIKEVIQHSDWKLGNAIAILISGKGKRVATAFAGKVGAAQLIADADEIKIEPDSNVALSPYRVKLFFGLPKSVGESTRQFSVSAKGDPRSTVVSLDPSKERELVRTIDRVMLGDVLELNFKPIAGLPILSGVELTKLDD